MALPSGGLMTAGRGEQAAAAELVAIRAERASQDLCTSRDYVLAALASPADRMTNLLIAGEACRAKPEAWKESGANTEYTVSLHWRANKQMLALTGIWTGAGPIGPDFSPTLACPPERGLTNLGSDASRFGRRSRLWL